MPHYYKITQGHGQGAELVMDAEAAFMQGHFERAVLLLERARVRAASCGQENMALCCDFLALRLSLCGQAGEPFAVPPSSSGTMPFCSTCWRASRPITTPCLAAPMPCPRSSGSIVLPP